MIQKNKNTASLSKFPRTKNDSVIKDSDKDMTDNELPQPLI